MNIPYGKRVLGALLLGLLSLAANAADPALRDVVVTATRSEAEVDSVPATVTTLTREEMNRRLPANNADLFRDEPDLAMPSDARRFGATRPNIRGLEDNRVVQMVDGVRLPDFYNGGGPTNFTMNAPLGVSIDFLRRVEVVRGSSSSLYGSDAIGGVVGFLTLDPADLLGSEASKAARLRASYFGANRKTSLTALAAARGETAELLIGVSGARAREMDNQGSDDAVSASRTAPNPQQGRDSAVLAKLVVRPASGHRLTAAVEGRELSVDTDVYRLSSSLPRVAWMVGDDRSRRLRGSLEWQHQPADGPYDRLTANVYRQDSDTRNDNTQRRSGTSASCSAVARGGNECHIEQRFSFQQNATGAVVQVEKLLQGGELSHLLTFGTELARVTTEEKRDASVWNLTRGSFSKSLAGDDFPLRDFANGSTDSFGVFLQDEIGGLAGGRLALIPALRYDWRRLRPDVDALAQSVLSAIDRQAVEQSDGAFSPKLAGVWKLSDTWSTYAQVAGSYRAPNYDEVNGAFRNLAQSYAVSPNPELEPETGVGFEAGLRLASRSVRGQLSVFDNRYQDFIESVRLDCPADPRCVPGVNVTNLSVNLNKVRIYGAELRGGWNFAPGWMVEGALAAVRGRDEDSGQPLNSVEPARLSLALSYDRGAWGAESRLRSAVRKSEVDDTGSEGAWFQPPGYAVVDLSAWWRVDRRTQLTVGVNNVFDRKYWLWSDIRQADARDPLGVDFYSQPGRSVNVALQMDF